jgi:hypothetical protein
MNDSLGAVNRVFSNFNHPILFKHEDTLYMLYDGKPVGDDKHGL